MTNELYTLINALLYLVLSFSLALTVKMSVKVIQDMGHG